ncbi:hypothetical protein HD554DRAFT_2316824, partial [Boletus coccyginus]
MQSLLKVGSQRCTFRCVRVSSFSDIGLRTQARRKMPVARKYYVHLFVDDASRSTVSAKEARNCTTWDEIFYFDGNDRSILLVKVYHKHCVGKDKLVGGLNDTICRILGKLKDGVFEVDLRKDTSDGSDLSGITIKFALAAEPRTDVNTDERQVSDAVAAATAAVNPLGLTPPVVGLLNSTVDISTHISTGMQTFETTWGVLLQRIELFNEIVADIAQIHPYASL